jgi:hypothetical protein
LGAGGLPLQLGEPRVYLAVAAVGDLIGERVEPVEAREDAGEGGAVVQAILNSGLDIAGIAGNLVGGGIAGAIVSTIVGLIVAAVRKK